MSSFVEMEYVGATSLTATGTLSGRTYRFDRPGARVQVELRDLASLRGVPNLKRLF